MNSQKSRNKLKKPKPMWLRKVWSDWHRGKKLTEEHKRKIGDSCKGNYHTEETKRKISRSKKKNFLNPDILKKIQTGLHRHPNVPEQYLMRILDNLFPSEYKYVGDHSFWIEGRNPDFVNINGQKKLIEFFGRSWHEPADESFRKNHFKKYGFDTLVIWSEELRDGKRLEKKLVEFHNG